MSIATEIAALQQDKSDIASAIANKGVSVPSGSGLDDFADLITSIPVGSSGWQRPEGWPDLDSLSDWKSTEEDTKCIVYMTYDNTIPEYMRWFCLRCNNQTTGSFAIDVGYVENGSFISIGNIRESMKGNNTFQYYYGNIQKDYVVFKLYSDNCRLSIRTGDVSASTTGDREIPFQSAPMLESVGHFAHGTGTMYIIQRATQRYYYNIIQYGNFDYNLYMFGYWAEALQSADIYLNDWETVNTKSFNTGESSTNLRYLNFHGNVTDAPYPPVSGINGINYLTNLTGLIKFTNPPVYIENTKLQSNVLDIADLNTVLDRLYDYSETETTKTITVGEYNLLRLSNAKIAQVTAKGWTLA